MFILIVKSGTIGQNIFLYCKASYHTDILYVIKASINSKHIFNKYNFDILIERIKHLPQ